MSPIPNRDELPQPGALDVLRDQRIANEQLVLATLRAQEKADAACEELVRAELAARLLRESEAELREVAEFRERMIGIIGHDLRGPLGTILMASGLVISHGQLSDADARLVGRVVESGQRMARMINQLVEFTRGRLGGGFELTLGDVDLGELAWNIAEELRIGTGADIQVSNDGEVTGRWDADRLAEVLSNIAGNAVDHATPGTPVLIDVRQDEQTVVVEITNQGREIPAEVLPVIFTAFRRAVDVGPARPNRSGHLGLGLYIASELVRCHGGTLEVRSTNGSTTFTIRLPRDFTSGDRVQAPSGALRAIPRR